MYNSHRVHFLFHLPKGFTYLFAYYERVFVWFFLYRVVPANEVDRTPSKKTGKYQDAMAANKREPTETQQSSRAAVAAAEAKNDDDDDAGGKCIRYNVCDRHAH